MAWAALLVLRGLFGCRPSFSLSLAVAVGGHHFCFSRRLLLVAHGVEKSGTPSAFPVCPHDWTTMLCPGWCAMPCLPALFASIRSLALPRGCFVCLWGGCYCSWPCSQLTSSSHEGCLLLVAPFLGLPWCRNHLHTANPSSAAEHAFPAVWAATKPSGIEELQSSRDTKESGSFHLIKSLKGAELKSSLKKKFPFKHTKTLFSRSVFSLCAILFLFRQSLGESRFCCLFSCLFQEKAENKGREAELHHNALLLQPWNTFVSKCF